MDALVGEAPEATSVAVDAGERYVARWGVGGRRTWP